MTRSAHVLLWIDLALPFQFRCQHDPCRTLPWCNEEGGPAREHECEPCRARRLLKEHAPA